MNEATLAETVTGELAERAWHEVGEWSEAQAERCYRQLCGRQPALLAYASAALEDATDAVFGLAIDLLLALDRTYELAAGRCAAAIEEDVVIAAANASEEHFLPASPSDPDRFLRFLLQSGEYAAPELPATLVAVLFAAVDTALDIDGDEAESLLAVICCSTRAYEIGHGISPAATRGAGRALAKVGRNEPCPCGSGKKFKRCCGQHQHTAPRPPVSPAQERFMDYIACAESVMAFAQDERSPDGLWLAKQQAAFEEEYSVGEDGMVPDSVHVNYTLFDLELPRARVAMGVLYGRRYARNLDAKSRRLLRELCNSYLAFYELTGNADGAPTFRELVSDQSWRGCDVDAPEGFVFEPGEVWLCRFVGPRDDAIAFGQPLIYPPQALPEIEQMLEDMLEELRAADPENTTPFPSAMKRAGEMLAAYITLTAPEEDEGESDEEEGAELDEEELDDGDEDRDDDPLGGNDESDAEED